MNYLDLFSGIGGFALAAEWAGITCDNHFNSDIDAYCNSVYQHHYPSSQCLGDITSIDGNQLKEQYGSEWIITGGFPCQDVSSAGKRAGIDGARSGLWTHYARLISELRPTVCIIENVRGLFNRGFGRVLNDLADCGYDAEWRTLRACDYGLAHNRQRVWIVAYPTGFRCSADAEQPQAVGNMGERTQPHGTADWLGVWVARQRASTERALRGQPLVSLRPDGVSDRVAFKCELARVKALGNSICPIIAADIFRRVIAAGLL
ncbi:DNA cytosine methyltransferase [Anatilimnocola floriformis]|uniref:DNA cytosine methyltransferase n=1 Tax=Anatilimnocola floriformis TaxID=2948575 RepID=UPI0020C1EB79|nr:DNA (cytosine-5-)-methyltransferase [Anatilimnocola floriformis]